MFRLEYATERSANRLGFIRMAWSNPRNTLFEAAFAASVVGIVDATSRKSVIEAAMCDIVKGWFNGHLICCVPSREYSREHAKTVPPQRVFATAILTRIHPSGLTTV
jgi:hypothetical protein